MLGFDSLREITATIKQNKLRTLLTGFAVAWGIFMLIVLLSAGNGFRNGVESQFESQAKNYVIINPGWTSKPHEGFSTGRRIRFDERDLAMLRREVPELEYLSAGMGTDVTITYGEEYISASVEGATDQLRFITNVTIKEDMGRFVNQIDMDQRRKVLILHPQHQTALFGDEDPIGKYVNVNNIPFRVIGVYGTSDQFYNNNPPAYIPLATAQMLFNRGRGFYYIELTAKGLTTIQQNEDFTQKLRRKMGELHKFDPADRSAIRIWNAGESAIQIQQSFGLINIFLIIVGLASMVAGIVGVGNIMYITVRERTREIGIRKAIGASPSSIVWLIILESIFITTCAGYAGIVMGVGLSELVSGMIGQGGGGDEMTIFVNPGVDMGIVIAATLLLIGCGVVAGLIPALKAVRVKPIEAMRAE